MSYAPMGNPRFSVVPTLDGEVLTISAVQNWFFMVFMSFWLALWTMGGLAAMVTFLVTFHPFILCGLMMWALAWMAVSSALAWMFAGKQTLRIVGQDLEVALNISGFQRRSLYVGREVRQICVARADFWPLRRWPQTPFGVTGVTGAVQFTYGARTRYVAPGMNQAEAAQIVGWLKKRLPGNE
jgi:hypothetical protein